MGDNCRLLTDLYGNSIVVINSIRFRGKRKINWEEVELYLKQFVGKSFKIEETKDTVYVNKDFPDEFSGSNDTARLQGTLAKAKGIMSSV